MYQVDTVGMVPKPGSARVTVAGSRAEPWVEVLIDDEPTCTVISHV
jgi:hypothetical protein